MIEQFVPFELAVKLKKLGFNEECFARFFKVGEEKPIFLYNTVPSSENGDIITIAPLWQQAFDFFREEKDLLNHLTTHLNTWGEDGALETSYGYRIMIDKDGWKCEVWEKVSQYDTYEEARLACLQELIKIVENDRR